MNRALDRLLRFLADLIVPVSCGICGEPTAFDPESSGPLCRSCCASIAPIKGDRCEACGLPLGAEIGLCMRCRGRSADFVKNHPTFLYSGTFAEAISLYKSNGRKELAPMFAAFTAREYDRRYRDIPIIPVPGRPASIRKRGWDQIEAIASILERTYGIPVCRVFLRKDGTAQKALDARGRTANLTGKLSIRPGAVVPSECVLLDDVFTTGATLDACADVLRRSGAAKVYGLTLAIDP